MFIAIILSAVIWTSPSPAIWVCNPGKSPLPNPIGNCERLKVSVLAKFWVPGA